MAGGSPGKVQPYVGEGAEPGDLEGTKYSVLEESVSSLEDSSCVDFASPTESVPPSLSKDPLVSSVLGLSGVLEMDFLLTMNLY